MPQKDAPATLGELRWRVTLASRDETPDPNSTTLIENYNPIDDVWAKITPTVALKFIGGEQIESPVSHQIIIRWQSFTNVQAFNVVARLINQPDGTQRQEVFRVRDVEEFEGRHRWIVMSCELEAFSS
jgi:hypothetical protein